MDKILVANRGEIACRIMRTCHALGHATVAIHAPVEISAQHVLMAKESVAIDAATPVKSYLDGAAIIAAAKKTGADAIHPGYGFLAENADFAQSVEDSGLIFIGPSAETIAAMGDKERARSLAEAAGVPVVPGSPRFAEGDLAKITEAGNAIGYPLLVKSCAGGGGIGMRIVERPEDLEDAARSTQTLAARSFNDGTIFLERYIRNARHVEVQVLGFGDGEAVHLFERECSIQRRFQKIVEESPSPGIDDGVRASMTEAALKLVRSVSYRGVGTLEFILDGVSQDFFFLEMNTRIQVEHPVTEMVTGRDLVALQIGVASGRIGPKDVQQSDVVFHGNAIEARLCAENPSRMFLPSPGELRELHFPAEGNGVRIETGYRQGDRVTPHFDSLIAKIICHGADRNEAIERMRGALAEIRMGEFVSNLSLLRAIVDNSAFHRGETFTDFLARNKEGLGL